MGGVKLIDNGRSGDRLQSKSIDGYISKAFFWRLWELVLSENLFKVSKTCVYRSFAVLLRIAKLST